MFVNQIGAGLNFHDKAFFHQDISEVLAQLGSILIENRERKLLLNKNPLFPQSMSQGILIDLLAMPVPMIFVNGKACLSYNVA
jgi:hypothetical protein